MFLNPVERSAAVLVIELLGYWKIMQAVAAISMAISLCVPPCLCVFVVQKKVLTKTGQHSCLSGNEIIL
jgi:hypothetical protein